MKHKLSELEGALLDAAVAKAEGKEFDLIPPGSGPMSIGRKPSEGSPWEHLPVDGVALVDLEPFAPSVLWEHGGPIIERERIDVSCRHGQWSAVVRPEYEFGDMVSSDGPECDGITPLIAAMRAYVASKFGWEVELP